MNVTIVTLAADENVLFPILLAVARTAHGEKEPFIVVYKLVAAPTKNAHSIFSCIPPNP